MYRVTYQNHIALSQLADNKANMLISINGVIISVMIAIVTRLGAVSWSLLPIVGLTATSLVSLITLSDLAFRAQTLNQATFRTVPIFILVLLIYLVLSLALTIAMRFAEDRASIGLARGRGR